MMEFKIGDRVSFQANQWETVEGMLTRYNKKTVTVIDDNGRQWNVSPGLLKKLESFTLDPSVQNAIPFLKNRKSSKNKRR